MPAKLSTCCCLTRKLCSEQQVLRTPLSPRPPPTGGRFYAGGGPGLVSWDEPDLIALLDKLEQPGGEQLDHGIDDLGVAEAMGAHLGHLRLQQQRRLDERGAFGVEP